jgi:PAS domain S-box-containing protein
MKTMHKKKNKKRGEAESPLSGVPQTGNIRLSDNELQVNEKKYRALFDNAPVGISVVDAERNILESNKALEKIVKVNSEELVRGLYRNFRYVRSDGTAMTENELPSLRAINEGMPVMDVEIGIVENDKIIAWTQVSAAPVYLPEPSSVVITQDITGRKNLEIRLKASEKKYRTSFENSLDAMMITSPDGKIHSANPAACKMLGWSEAELCRLGRDGVVAQTPHLISAIKKRKTTGTFFGELTFIRKNGTKFPVEISSSVFTDSDGKKLTSMIVRDISDRKKTENALQESEERHRHLLESSGLGIGYYDTDGKILLLNHEAVKNLGGKVTDYIGKNLSEVYGEATSIVYLKRLYDASISEIPVQYEDYIKTPGISGWYKSTYSRIVDKNGLVEGIQVIFDNITSRKSAEKKLKDSQKKLQKLTRHLDEIREEERSSIALNLHDDFGQRLTALFMDIAWVKTRIGVQSPAVVKKLEEISFDINETIEALKEISSILRPAILFDLGLVPAVTSLLNKFEQQSGIKCYFYYNPEEFEIEEGISLILYRIIQESLTNIARHSGAYLVELKLNRLKDKILLAIRDDGVGIDKDKLNSMNSMGLEGIRERVTKVHGEVLIKGEKGKGTIVKVTIPVKRRTGDD